MKLRLIALFMLALACRGAAEQAPFSTDTGAISHEDIYRIERGDTVAKIIAKFGGPAPSEIRLPVLIYELKENRKKMFILHFDLKDARELKDGSVLREVVFDDGKTRRPVWPIPAKKEANQLPVPMSGLRPAMAHR